MKKIFTKFALALLVLAFIPISEVNAQNQLEISHAGYKATLDEIKSQQTFPVKRGEVIVNYDGDNESALGANAASTYIVAVRFTPEELAPYYNSCSITKVRYFIKDTSYVDSIRMLIYGSGTATEPGVLLVDEPADTLVDGWDEFSLPTPLTIVSGDYWVGYEVETSGGCWPVGTDAGPMVPGKGGWYYSEATGWKEIASFHESLNRNLNIRAVLSSSSSCPPITNLAKTVNSNNTVTLNWTTPDQSSWPSDCDGDIYFEFYNGTTEIGHNDTDSLTSWTTSALEAGTYSLGVRISYWKNSNEVVCYANTVFVDVTIENEIACPGITNLEATVNPDNTVTLNWINPDPSTYPSTDIDYWFYDGDEQIGSDWTNNLTTWVTPMLTQGTHNLGVQVGYYDSGYICKTDTVFVEVNITNSYTCPPVNNLTATVNSDNTVTLNWTNPDSSNLPSTCDSLEFRFYLGATILGFSYEDSLNSWTSTSVFPNGTHTFDVVVYYYNNNGNYICDAKASVTVTISSGIDCPSVNNLSATVNPDNTVDLSWTLPTELPTGCNGDIDFLFYNGSEQIGFDHADSLTSWTTPVFSEGTHNLTVVIYYLDSSYNIICFAEASITVTTSVEELKASILSAEIYPNPAKDLLNIECDSEIKGIELYDALGRMLINKINIADTKDVINVSSLNHGMYMLRLHTENGSGIFKVIIE